MPRTSISRYAPMTDRGHREYYLAGMDPDSTITFNILHDDNIPAGTKCSFQFAVLYTDELGRRRLRLLNVHVGTSASLSVLYEHADLAGVMHMLVQKCFAAVLSVPHLPLSHVIFSIPALRAVPENGKQVVATQLMEEMTNMLI